MSPVAPAALSVVDHRAARGDRVDAAGVGDEPRAPVDDDTAAPRRTYSGQVAREAERLVALAVLLEDGQRELGQRLAHQVVDAGVEHVGAPGSWPSP